MLAEGGNAIDAAFAANFVLGVVTPYMCGFGGDLLAMVWDGGLNAYRGVGRAPAGANAEFVREQSGESEMPVFGAHPVTVPGAVEAWFTLIEKFATRSFGELAQRALHYAEEGFPVTKRGVWFFENLAMPPPTQGVTALEALRIVDGLELGPDGPDREHLLIEAVKLALADRRRYLGDPDAMTIAPEQILRDDWIASRRADVDPRRARVGERHAEPDGGTIYMCAADCDGMLVSLIQSN